MAVAVSYPGVYIQEVPSGSRAIAGVPTSVAAFVGYTARGPVSEPVQIFSFADFERSFGGLHLDSELSYAVNHFFLNGGATAWIVRVAENAAAASVSLMNTGGDDVLTATASSEGSWGNNLVLLVDYDTANPASSFNLTVSEFEERNGRLVAVRSETHRNLSMNPAAPTYAVTTVNAASELISLADVAPAGTASGTSESAPLGDGDLAVLNDDTRRLAISLDGGPVYEFDIFSEGNPAPDNLVGLAVAIQTAVRALENNNTFNDFTAEVLDGRILATSGSQGRGSSVTFRQASVRSATAVLGLGLANGGREADGAAAVRPAANGTTSQRIPDFSALAIGDDAPVTINLTDAAGNTVSSLSFDLGSEAPTSFAEARARIQAALQASTVPAFGQATVRVTDQSLVIRPGGTDFSQRFVLSGNGSAALLLSGAADEFVNVAAYQPGAGPSVGGQTAGDFGADGDPPSSTVEIVGSRAQKTGFYALEDVDLFNILNLPGVSDVAALAEAIAYAEERRSMIIIDIDPNVNTLEEARDWINDSQNSSLKHRNAVAYFPRVRLADPLQNNRLRTFANAGLMAGLYARTDAQRGVWKAPAGIEARLRGVQALDYVLSDPENGVLNPLGLNCLRSFPVFGTVSWGSRTLVGADALTSEWKNVPVRRLALFIEESLYRGTQFVVFEPNDEPLWAQIRLSVGSFMNNLFRQGAFQGATPQESYSVRCDSSTTTQADIDLGIVNIVVGFAPLKPAEFVIIQIQQMAGQSQG